MARYATTARTAKAPKGVFAAEKWVFAAEIVALVNTRSAAAAEMARSGGGGLCRGAAGLRPTRVVTKDQAAQHNTGLGRRVFPKLPAPLPSWADAAR